MLWSLLSCLPFLINDFGELLLVVPHLVVGPNNDLPFAHQKVWDIVVRQERLLEVVDLVVFSLSEQFLLLESHNS